MAIRRRCSRRRCKNGRRCLAHLEFDVMHVGVRYRMHANEFAIPRMEVGKQRPIESMDEARRWERTFIGELTAGRDPRHAPSVPVVESPPPAPEPEPAPRHVAAFLDAFLTLHVKPSALRSIASVESRIGVLKEHFGEFLVSRLEGSGHTPRSDQLRDGAAAAVA